VQLIHGKRDGTTGMLIDEVAEPFSPVTGSGGIGSMLRGRGSAGGGTTAEPAAPATADFGNDNSYLDIPAFLRRQAD
jgi:cell division protein FtsZ